MSDFLRYLWFVALTVAIVWLLEHLSGKPILDDANARMTPYREIQPISNGADGTSRSKGSCYP